MTSPTRPAQPHRPSALRTRAPDALSAGAPASASASGALGPGREFDLIRRLVAGAGALEPGIEVGSGDDAAVLEGGWVVSCDLSLEGVHFERAWLSPEAIGGRALRGAMSDLAAMAAEPVAVLVSLAGSARDHTDGTLAAVGLGVRSAAEECGASVIGGDLTRSTGPLVVDVTVIGRTSNPILRSGAQPGDDLWVTGTLGAAATAVRLHARGLTPDESLRTRFERPEPRLAAARWLAATGFVHALIDLSDGLVGDAGHLAAASGVRLHVEAERVPQDPAAVDLVAAVAGGEDYELLFAADPALRTRVAEFEAACPGLALTRIGHVHPIRAPGAAQAAGDARAAGAAQAEGDAQAAGAAQAEGDAQAAGVAGVAAEDQARPGVAFTRDGAPWHPPHAYDHFAENTT